MTKKAFANWTGKDRHLTRDEYVNEWLDTTIQYGTLFGADPQLGKYLEFRGAVAEIAGQKWDKAE